MSYPMRLALLVIPVQGRRGFPGGSAAKNLSANAGDISLIPGSGRFPGGEHGNPPQHSSLENPMDRGAWWTTVHGVGKSQTRLKQVSRHVGKGEEVGAQRVK